MSCFDSLLGWQFTIAQVFKSSAVEGYFPKLFSKVTKSEVSLIVMLIITAVQTGLALSTMSPSLNKQFNILVDLAVVTNIIPYLLSMASVSVIQETVGVPLGKSRWVNFVAFVGSVYSLMHCMPAALQR